MKSIYLRNAEYEIIVKGWEKRKEEIKGKLEEDFKVFTKGTKEECRNEDQLYYLDLLRKKLDDREYADVRRDYVICSYDCECDYDAMGSEFKVIFDDDFGEWAFGQGNKPLYVRHQEPEFYNLLLFVICVIINYGKHQEQKNKFTQIGNNNTQIENIKNLTLSGRKE